MAASTISYDNVIIGAADPVPGRVVVLGCPYQLPQDNIAYHKNVQSKIWCTYRKSFKAISGSSITSDAGWGCTLRCGQMLLAEAIVQKQLGKDWRWSPKSDDPVYMKILTKFLDTSTSDYSLHLIALQGVDLGRPLGHWFGPNNVAQVIKKLAVHDTWNQLVVHVAMDMLVVMDDIVTECRQPHGYAHDIEVTLKSTIPRPSSSTTSSATTTAPSDKLVTMELHMKKNSKASSGQTLVKPSSTSRSILLLIPLRLGQDSFNMQYADGLKACFDLPQCVGVIGGKPRHALWFIGHKGDHLVFLDPHTTQPTVRPSDPAHVPDTSYHCNNPGYMKISDIDPSIAVGFFACDEQDFNELCSSLQATVLKHHPPMFEIVKERPHFWGSCMDGEVIPERMLQPTLIN